MAESSTGLPYLVMSFIEGRSLQERIDETGPLAVEEILRIGMQAASGLAAAHAQALVHRDVKPANILLENGVERVKLTDFGLARAVDDAAATRSGVIAGTPQYMSPEQARGEAVDPRSDLFSLGSVLYAMATGHSPFRADGPMAVLRRVTDDCPRSVREQNPAIPSWLERIILKLLAKRPDRRFQTAEEVSSVLGRWLAHVQDPARIPAPEPVGSGRRRATAILVLGLAGSIALGVVFKLVSPEGTLVIEVEDPSVEITIDGRDLKVRGLGIQETRLRLGEHRVVATKDGKPVVDELVSITRDGKPVVKVRREPGAGDEKAGSPMQLEVPRWYRPGPDSTADPKSATITIGPVIPGLTPSVALRPTSPDDPFPAPVWPGSAISYAAYSPDGSTLALASNLDRTILLFDARTRELKGTLKGHRARVWTMAFAPDGKSLAVATGHWSYPSRSGEVRAWNLAHPEGPGEVIASDFPLAYSLAYSPEGKTLAFGGWDDLLYRFDLTTKPANSPASEGHEDAIRSIAYSPDGQRIATASY
ncbi:MAG: serine/threonine-protein kinase, partial [Thermoplasmata archaeon]|nr:serine/threonine-protein kinase [Thermoplasmata archaeon]